MMIDGVEWPDDLIANWSNCETPDCAAKAVEWGFVMTCWPCGVRRFGEDFMIALFNANHPWTYEQARDLSDEEFDALFPEEE